MIGIIADSHDNIPAIKKAVKLLNKTGVDLVIHAGDLIAPFTVREFEKLNCKFEAIFGNNDGERNGLRSAYKDLCKLYDFKEINHNKKRIAVIHGTNEAIVDSIVKSEKYDIVIRGHSHKAEIMERESLVINPGEVCGYVSGHKTIVLLDPKELSYKILDI
jgi:uncharacterized protein